MLIRSLPYPSKYEDLNIVIICTVGRRYRILTMLSGRKNGTKKIPDVTHSVKVRRTEMMFHIGEILERDAKNIPRDDPVRKARSIAIKAVIISNGINECPMTLRDAEIIKNIIPTLNISTSILARIISSIFTAGNPKSGAFCISPMIINRSV